MSLRNRLILSFALVVVICLGIAAISVSVLLTNYRDQVVLVRLDDMTRPISNQIRTLLRGQTTLAQAWTSIQTLAQDNGTYIIFVDDKGNVLREANPNGSAQVLDVPGGLPHGISQATHGIFTTTSGQQFVYSAYPLARTADTVLPRPQTLVLSQPRSDVGTVLSGLVWPFIWAAIIALAISLGLAFLLARSVYRPIRRLSSAAQNIARGHFDEPVPVSGPQEIKALAQNFNEMAGKLRESQQQMRHFVADVSHQLKSPLTSIQGFAEAMVDGTAADEETRQKAARIIDEESRRMIRQVNELLELSRMQAGQIKLTKAPVSVHDILSRCEEIFALRLEEKKITLKDQSDIPTTINADADRLEDVFSNLLDNAIKNTPMQGEIRVSARKNTDATVSIAIADSGPGIPPEQLPHVFERFQQSSGLRNGFGLGLAIAREIVLAHGGKIEASSEPGEGARFAVTLPLE